MPFYRLRMRFADLIAPVPLDRFMTEIFGRQPLHVPAPPGGTRRQLVGWSRLNELLAIRSHWTEANLKMILNSRPVFPQLYMDEVDTMEGRVRRANSAKVDVFLGMGASLVANAVEEIAPEVRALTSELGDVFSARTGANIYCSFKDVQAFGSHCDLHEVFAVQCEGEKVWNIYENRAAAPVEQLQSGDAQAMIDAAKGKVMLQVRMQPGDMLYIPRGYYHDALASSVASLHVSVSVTPLTGRALFRLLEDAAVQDPLVREYLPDARESGGEPLRKRLSKIAERLAAIATSDEFHRDLRNWQRQLWDPDYEFQLPARKQLEFYARSDQPARIEAGANGEVIRGPRGSIPIGGLGEPANWLLGRAAFSLQELFAGYRHLDQSELRQLVLSLERCAIIYRYTPQV